MKTSNKILTGGLIFLAFCSMAMVVYIKKEFNIALANKIAISGKLSKAENTLTAYKEIQADINADIKVFKGNPKYKIEADESWLKHITFEVKDSILHIYTESNLFNIGEADISIELYTNEIQALSLLGSGNLEMIDSFSSNTIDINLSGSGDMKTNFITHEAQIDLVGSGSIEANGKSNKININLSGSGDIDCKNINSNTATVAITGSGNIYINAIEELDAAISGSGDIYYLGRPKVKSSITGSGEVGPLEE